MEGDPPCIPDGRVSGYTHLRVVQIFFTPTARYQLYSGQFSSVTLPYIDKS